MILKFASKYIFVLVLAIVITSLLFIFGTIYYFENQLNKTPGADLRISIANSLIITPASSAIISLPTILTMFLGLFGSLFLLGWVINCPSN